MGSLSKKAKKYGYGDLTAAYYNRESEKLKEAKKQFGSASPEELALMEEQVKAVQQASEDRRSTRDLILAQMGFKLSTGEDGQKTLVPLTQEERLGIMSKADQSRAAAVEAYQGRAKAAASGTTQLPSFLKKDIDTQKSKEEALLGELLGPEALSSTAGKQAIEALKKKEEEIRQRIQEQDLATAPGKSMGLSDQLARTKGQKMSGYEALPNQGAGLISGRGSILQQMQQQRLDEYKKRLGEIEGKRQMIQQFYTLGGTFGGAAAAAANQRKTQPQVQNYPGGGNYWADGSYKPAYNSINYPESYRYKYTGVSE